MTPNEIHQHEQEFFKYGKDSDGKSFKNELKTISAGKMSMDYVRTTPYRTNKSFYVEEVYEKKQIVLHYTAGFLQGDVAALTRPNRRVSTPFLISRSGLIYNLFPSFYWSYHLGPGAIGGNKTMSQQTIGVELSNIGFLTRKGDKLYNGYGGYYCKVDDVNEYTELKEDFRGETYFANFTTFQYKSLSILLQYLTKRYNIPYKFLPEQKRFQVGDNDLTNFRGIVSHVNYRSSGKWDIGPAFNWAWFLKQ